MLFLLNVAHAQVVPNPSLDGPLPTAVPNTSAATDWTFDGASLATDGIPIDCAEGVLIPSSNGGTYARALAYFQFGEGPVNEALSTTVTGLAPGVPYLVKFEAALVRHLGQSTGHWTVELDGTPLDAPALALPTANPSQGPWEPQAVGPFLVASDTATLVLRAVTLYDGTTVSPALPTAACPYGSNSAAVDLLVDGIVVVGDHDLDGLYDDQEALLGTDPFSADTDGDALDDLVELELGLDPTNPDTDGDLSFDGAEIDRGTDPMNPDTDADGLVDGLEAELGTDPFAVDTDGDSLQDGFETSIGTDPLTADTDGDGLSDGEEYAAGSDPTDPNDPTPTDTGVYQRDPHTGSIPKDSPVAGCACDAGGAPGPWLALLAVGAVVWRRRSWTLVRESQKGCRPWATPS